MQHLISIAPSKHAGACVVAAKTTLGNVCLYDFFFSFLLLFCFSDVARVWEGCQLKEGNYQSRQHKGL